MKSSTKVIPLNGVDQEDQILKNGPINQRECRDVLCCLLFIGALCASVYFFILATINGQPNRLIAVYDKAGSPCGLDAQSNRKYLYFYAPISGQMTQTTCVKDCPSSSLTTMDCDTASMPAGSCDKINCSNMSTISSNSICFYDTEKFLGRVCAPTASALASFSAGAESAMDKYLNMSTLSGWINDISIAKWIILSSVGIAFVLGLLYMIFLRIFAGLLVWIAIISYFAGIIVLGYFSYKKASDIQTNLDENGGVDNGSNTSSNKQCYMYIAYILWAFAGICFVVFLCLYRKIRQAIAIIKTTSLFVRDVWSTMLVPPCFTLIVACWWVIWLIGFVYLYSVDETGMIKKSESSIFADVKHSSLITKLLWAYVFIGLWVNAFIQAVCQFVLASSACIWYFSHGEDGAKHSPVFTSIYRAFRYHLGSLAFGSLLLAIVQLIRVVLAYIEQQIKKTGGNNNKLIKFIVSCLQCYMACFERFIKFLNQNAYIQIALKGQNFCAAAKDALSLIVCNADRFVLVNGIGGAFIFIGKLFITCATTFVCYLILTQTDPYKSELSSVVLPCIVIFAIGYAISIVFMSVYGMGMQAILVCFLWDEKMCGNSVPQHAPPMLQEFFEEQEK